MTKTTFVNGSPVTPAFLNAINNPTFVDTPAFDGEITRISNNDLSNTAGQIKPEWIAFRDALKVSAGTGLNAAYVGGSVTLPLGTILTISPGTIALQNNALNYVFVNEIGGIAASLTYPAIGVLLASVTTVGSAITTIIDLRPRFRVQPITAAIKVFGGTGEQGDYTLSSTATFADGIYYFKNFTVQAGATLTVSQFAKIHCSGTVTIAGTIIVTTAAAGGAGFATGLTSNIGGLSGAGNGGGSGTGVGKAYSYASSPIGSGGSSGFASFSSGGGVIASGGDGAGGLWLEAAGAITVSGTILAKGANGGVGSLASGAGSISGAGGGSGGLILLSSLASILVTAAATLDVRGGNGGNAATGSANGGGPGGGGQVVCISPSNNTSGASILLSGGVAGGALGGGTLGGGTGGGFGGVGGSVTAGAGLLIFRNFRAVG